MSKVTLQDWRGLYVGFREELAATRQAVREFRRFILSLVFAALACCATLGVAFSSGNATRVWDASLLLVTLGLLRHLGLVATVGLRLTLLSCSSLAAGRTGYGQTVILLVTVAAAWVAVNLPPSWGKSV